MARKLMAVIRVGFHRPVFDDIRIDYSWLGTIYTLPMPIFRGQHLARVLNLLKTLE
jgi:hypothetical protein